MPTALALTPTVKSKIIQAIVALGDRYCREYLNAPYLQKNSLERNWWGGLRLFLNHSFYQGRRDEVSEKVEAVAMPVLSKYFEEREASQIGATDFKQLAEDLRAAMTQGKAGKGGDAKMLVGIFEFVSKLPEKNLTLYSLGRIREGRLADHYRELDSIFQIGEKVASFYLRDLVCIYGVDELVQQDDLKFLQPIDVWVRKVAHRLGIIPAENCTEDEVRSRIIETCSQCGVSAFKFNQGAWYLGKNAFDILIGQLDKITFE